MKLGKRVFDLFWTCLGLMILWPLFLVVAVIIKLRDRGPIFFRQKRVGRRGKVFGMWKFRTMVVNAEQLGKQLTIGQDPRITSIGRWLRKSKLDELPQLFNVLAGDMSLVGPRPEVPRYVDLYTTEQRQVLEITPGITDPASIRFRSENDLLAKAEDPEATYIEKIMPEKIRLNLEYAQRSSVPRDFLIVLQTLRRIME